MTENDANYLRSLVRMDIRKKEKQIARFSAKPGQTEADVAAVRRNMTQTLEFRRHILAELREPHRELVLQG